MHVNRQLGSIAKLMKLRYLYYYAQAHSRICCVLITLQPLYGQAHAPYDQTHGPYAEAHIFQELGVARNYLNSHPLTTFGELLSSSYMEWVNGLVKPNPKPMQSATWYQPLVGLVCACQ
jgi:hypothetical protein